jgi:uncharacterized protein
VRFDATTPHRVGLVADTHVGEFLDALPEAVPEALAGCDLILHAGDMSTPDVLRPLREVAPVVAVRGDHDRGADHLPRRVVVTVEGVRIGLTHGSNGRAWDTGVTLAQNAAGRVVPWRRALHTALVSGFGTIDVLVYGHWHAPVEDHIGSVLCICPGAVCPRGSLEGGRPPRPGPAGVADRVVRRFRDILGPEAMVPRVGILDIGPAGIRHRPVPLAPHAVPVPLEHRE